MDHPCTHPAALRRRAFLAAAAAATQLRPAAAAPAPDPAAILKQVLQAPSADPSLFASSFLNKVPIDRLNAVLAAVHEQLGAFKSVEGSSTRYVAHFDRGDITAHIVLNGQGLITGLLLRPKDSAGLDEKVPGSLQDHLRAIAGLPGSVALLVASGGRTIANPASASLATASLATANLATANLAADKPLAVGSAFKLAVLKAVAEACDAGRLSWGQSVGINPAWRTLGSGSLQSAPPGTQRTITQLAAGMIAMSDNMAADALINTVGRAAIETIARRDTPFLTTREAFILKARYNAPLRAQWTHAGAAGRRAMLPAINAQALPAAADVETTPTLDVEWHFTALEIQALLESVGHLPAFDANPGLAIQAAWQHVAFKGGSDAGVLNLSTRLTGHDGATHTVIATWNNSAPLDAALLEKPYAGILQSLAAGIG